MFEQAFEKAELANLGQADLDKYEDSLKAYRDLKGVIDTAFDDGKKEREIEIVIQAKLTGLSITDISKMTGLSEEEINNI